MDFTQLISIQRDEIYSPLEINKWYTIVSICDKSTINLMIRISDPSREET